MDLELLELQTEYLNDLPDKLDLIYELLLSIEKEEDIDESLNNLKGIIHSIKGSSGSYEISFLSELCHSFEDELDLLTKDKNKVLINCFYFYELLKEFSDFYIAGEEADLDPFYNKLSELSHSNNIHTSTSSSKQKDLSKKILIITDDEFFKDAIMLSLEKLNTKFYFLKKTRSFKNDDDPDFIFLVSPEKADVKQLKSISPQTQVISLNFEDNVNFLPSDFARILISHHLVRDIRHGYLALLQKEENIHIEKEAHPENILFVDDDESIHPLVKVAFKAYKDIKMNYCHSAKEAQEVLKSFTPDLILLDSMMPEISGKEFKKLLSEDENLKDIPVLFLTGLDSKKEIEELKNLGAVDVICKPFKIKELAGQVLKIWSEI
ncbi:MAG: hypothetical protein DRQ88_12310 [Epsilonproteobacteria bacterium]|nr:MAG: hypothetical protein DRQ88_12310 [Campylobacterota bacterium]RLA64788.1 MAG: hypothetical protein DRQ89_02930 [Campylobacterota bacterium]